MRSVSKTGQFSDGAGEAAARAPAHGELPTAISKEGVTWPENVARGTDDAIAALQASSESRTARNDPTCASDFAPPART